MSPAAIGGIIFVVIFVIIIIVAVASIPTLPSGLPGPSGNGNVVVTQVFATSSDNACGLNAANLPGFTDSGFANHPIGWVLTSGIPCTVSSVSTPTPGFNVEASVPRTFNQSFQILLVNVLCPPSYNGPLTINFA